MQVLMEKELDQKFIYFKLSVFHQSQHCFDFGPFSLFAVDMPAIYIHFSEYLWNKMFSSLIFFLDAKLLSIILFPVYR